MDASNIAIRTFIYREIMKNKDIYLVAFYFAKPKPGVRTNIKGWMNDPNNIRYDEKVEITRGVKNNAIDAKVVLNLSTKTVDRNGWNDTPTFDDLFKYYFTGYHKYVTTVMTQLDPEYFDRMLDEMQVELDQKKALAAEIQGEKSSEEIPAE